MAGHGVIGWDAKKKRYTLHWFDTFGSPPGAPGTGQWQGGTLKFYQEGSGNTIFQLADGGLIEIFASGGRSRTRPASTVSSRAPSSAVVTVHSSIGRARISARALCPSSNWGPLA